MAAIHWIARWIDLYTFLDADVFEAGGDLGVGQAAEVVVLAARVNRLRNFVGVGGGENELHVRWRLLERLEQRIERRRREHMHFVDDHHAETVAGGAVLDIAQQLAHLFHTVVGSAVDFEHIHVAGFGDLLARSALAAGLDRRAVARETVERLGKDARAGGLACATRPREEECVGDLVARDGAGKSLLDVALPGHVLEGLRPVLEGDDFVCGLGHG